MNSSAAQSLFGPATFVEFSLANCEQQDLTAQAEVVGICRVEMWENGVLYFEPVAGRDTAASILISCGVHGNETAPIELVDNLVSDLLNGSISLSQRLLVVFANPCAARQQVRFIDDNLNRLFCGGKAETEHGIEAKRAALIENLTQQFFNSAHGSRFHYDLHTAIRGSQHEKFAVYPFLHDRDHAAGQLGFLEHCGIEAVLLSHKPATTYSYYTSNSYQADAFTVELGRVHPFGDNDLGKYIDLMSGLHELLEGSEDFTRQPRKLRIYAVVAEVIKRSPDIQFSFSADTKNFTAYEKGQVLVIDGDYRYTIENDGDCIIFPHKDVPVGHRALLVASPTQL